MFGVVEEHRPHPHPDPEIVRLGIDDLGGKPWALIPFDDGEQLGNRVGEMRAYRPVGHRERVQRAQP